MATKKKLNEELEDVLAKIGKAKRELKALRRQANDERNSPGSYVDCLLVSRYRQTFLEEET